MRTIELTKGFCATVDDEDYARLSGMKWHAWVKTRSDGTRAIYAQCNAGKMHRIIMNAPRGVLVDHIDGDSLNNTRANLRLVTVGENNMNRRGVFMRSGCFTSSRFKGVTWNRAKGKWQAAIRVDGRSRHLGLFAHEQDAAEAYDIAAAVAFGQFAKLNQMGA